MIKDHLGHPFVNEQQMYLFWGLNEWTYYERKMSGWSLEKILTTPLRKHPVHTNIAPVEDKKKLISKKSYKLGNGTVEVREYQY